MKKSSKKQLKHFKQFQQLEQSKEFLKSLNKKVWLGSSLILIILLFLLLPSPGYYQGLNLFWQPAKVKKVEVEVAVHLYPVNKTQAPFPSLSARSIVVMDVNSSVVLYQKNADLPLLPASTTKIMTGIVVLENYSLDQVLTIGNLEKNGQVIKLLPGEQMTVENLLYGLLVASGNDAAVVLASYFPGGQPAFVEAMNKKAQELNLTKTHFENPTGIDHPNHYSTALDLARLSAYGLKDPVFAKIVATDRITIWDISKTIPHQLFNINELMSRDLGVVGVKTGWTEEAGECLVAHTKKDGHARLDSARQGIISVILGSQDRFGETERLINWVFENFEWEEIKIPNI